MDCRDTPQNPTSADKPRNESANKPSDHNITDTPVQDVACREATTSSKHHLSADSKRDEGDVTHHDYVNSSHFADVNPSPLLEYPMVASSSKSSIPHGTNMNDPNNLTSFNCLINENAFNTDFNQTLDSTNSDYSTARGILNSTSNDTTLVASLNSTSNNYDHLGARPKTPLSNEPRKSKSLFKGNFKNGNCKDKKSKKS